MHLLFIFIMFITKLIWPEWLPSTACATPHNIIQFTLAFCVHFSTTVTQYTNIILPLVRRKTCLDKGDETSNQRCADEQTTDQCVLYAHINSQHLLKKSGANRKQAYADREEFTDRRANYERERQKRNSINHWGTPSVHQQEATWLCMLGGSTGVDGSIRSAHPIFLRLHVELITNPGQRMDSFGQH